MTSRRMPPDRSAVATERPHPASARLDAMDAVELAGFLAEDQRRAVAAVEAVAGEIGTLADEVAQAIAGGGRLVYLGAGTSGRLGVLDASECPPTFNCNPGQVVGVIAGGDSALRRSSEGAEDDPAGAHERLDGLGVGDGDVVLGIAAGGTTPWVLGGLAHAHDRGAGTALLSCAPRTVPHGCDRLLVLDTGHEPLTGSTRMVAGTATKIALNILTTTVFTRLGKVRGNRMIDLRATNDKLHDRCLRIMCELFPELDRVAADELLQASDGHLRDTVERYESKS
ncbi:MAG: N-acetylmuramic acid 6-phosphate etherase [Phycisphaerales bacterium]|nr:N-acetylmuramic acid 6-phosphate etherase [Phycisphaerales bacterium]